MASRLSCKGGSTVLIVNKSICASDFIESPSRGHAYHSCFREPRQKTTSPPSSVDGLVFSRTKTRVFANQSSEFVFNFKAFQLLNSETLCYGQSSLNGKACTGG